LRCRDSRDDLSLFVVEKLHIFAACALTSMVHISLLLTRYLILSLEARDSGTYSEQTDGDRADACLELTCWMGGERAEGTLP